MSINYGRVEKSFMIGVGAILLLLLAAVAALGVICVQHASAKCDYAVGVVASAMASAHPAPAPSASAPKKREALHETMTFMVLTPRGREEASERCRRRGGKPDVDVAKVVCYGTGDQRYQKLFVYDATDAMVDDSAAGGGGAAP